MRNLILVLGDQLSERSTVFDGFEKSHDRVWMAEVDEESQILQSHKARIVLFLSSMRHFRDSLRKKGISVEYTELEDAENQGNFRAELGRAIKKLSPVKLIVAEPGEWRVKENLSLAARDGGLQLEIRPDRHFICSTEEFSEYKSNRKKLVMEFFYREMRRKTNSLMDDNKPVGGKWNYDRQNRSAFSGNGPGKVSFPVSFYPDSTTRAVIKTVEARFPNLPGTLHGFDWPVTPRQAKKALTDFIEKRLSLFGTYQDAMWTDSPYLYHSRLSSSLNLKLIDPREVISAALGSSKGSKRPLNSVEGFIRQVLGWREYVRGIYWTYMPEYINRNSLDAHMSLPWFYWTGDTEMSCLRECISQTLKYGYAHHIQRLMVTGLFAMLLGVEPVEVHKWYLGIYVDAVEWVELPNTLGMSQYADGGIMATKPYAATGKYISRMSNYCRECGYEPSIRTGEKACPFTVLYWDFLARNEKKLSRIPRMGMQINNLRRIDRNEKSRINRQVKNIKKSIDEYLTV